MARLLLVLLLLACITWDVYFVVIDRREGKPWGAAFWLALASGLAYDLWTVIL